MAIGLEYKCSPAAAGLKKIHMGRDWKQQYPPDQGQQNLFRFSSIGLKAVLTLAARRRFPESSAQSAISSMPAARAV